MTLLNKSTNKKFCEVTYQSWVEVFDTDTGEFKVIDLLKTEQVMLLINSKVAQQSLIEDLDSIVDNLEGNLSIINKGIHIFDINIDEECLDYHELVRYVKRNHLDLNERLVNLETAITDIIDEIEDETDESY